ncbi:MAG: HNH endonuclease signature motif containing protein, partial [Mycobacteriales bacterium]
GDTCRATLNGIPITPNTVRMLACDAAIIPIVMRGTSEILDLGRTTRTWTRAQRKAAKIRAGQHCEAPLCQAAIARCELHHEDEWAKFGRTDLDNGIYLCTYHHWLVHHTHWVITRSKTTGQVEIRRT